MRVLDHFEQMADRARQAVETHDDERLAGADLAHELGKGRVARDAPEPCSWTITSQPAERSSMTWVSVACSSVETRAYQAALWSTGSAILRVSGHLQRLRVRLSAGFQTQRIRITDRFLPSSDILGGQLTRKPNTDSFHVN